MKKMLLFCLVVIFLAASCATNGGPKTKTEKGAVYGTVAGAAVGAAVGQAIGRDKQGTLWGTGAGAVVGGLAGAALGRMMDEQEKAFREVLAASDAQAAAQKEELRTEVVRQEAELLSIVLKGDVTFDTNSSKIKKEMYPELRRIADVMIKYPDTSITVEGHTDNQGKESYNMDLSRQRAEAVKTLLIQNGVASSRIETMAFGENSPVAPNNTSAGRLQNRRVEIKIAPKTS
ncbi:OmpA family protein [Desulfonema magnum]|uniref:OmpA-like domain-containing protein n=1 Tax=Desulfonema magnum TaxID=45655 RepID=A0A975BQT9_9BACT|nr:OmpA family protein [Desulfonema magnum]QTA89792.1 OmpA-like domain-containing protein [Desulfonema magnum]